MNSTFRPTSIADLPAVRQFLQTAFSVGQDTPFLDPAVMAWKYWDPREDWNGPRAYVLERNGAIVAHAGIYPLTFDDGKVKGIQMIDWAAARESPGAGIALVQKLTSMFDFIYSIGGSDITRKILPMFGFKEYAWQWNAACVFRPFQHIVTHQRRNWKLVPRLARNLVLAFPTALRSHPIPEGWMSKEIQPVEICRSGYSQTMRSAYSSPRSPAFFDYLLRCPVMNVRLYSIHRNRNLKGHFAIGVVRKQVRLAGVWLEEPNREAWQAALLLAQQIAMQDGTACEFVAAGSQGISEEGAADAGLRIVRHTPVYLLNKQMKLALRRDFQFQLSDDDAFFLDQGKSSYWL